MYLWRCERAPNLGKWKSWAIQAPAGRHAYVHRDVIRPLGIGSRHGKEILEEPPYFEIEGCHPEKD